MTGAVSPLARGIPRDGEGSAHEIDASRPIRLHAHADRRRDRLAPRWRARSLADRALDRDRVLARKDGRESVRAFDPAGDPDLQRETVAAERTQGDPAAPVLR